MSSEIDPKMSLDAESVSMHNTVVNTETIAHFAKLALSLKRIHVRLVAEGFTVKDGVISPPSISHSHE